MKGPLLTTLELSNATDLLLAIPIGFAFGFILERAGFGRADRLVDIFYGRDFRVMRVMFTAVVTAMLGLYGLDAVGVMPLGDIAVLSTYLWPQLVAGVLLGAGFIIGGYCPGTSFVAVASGKLDALLFIGGLFAGSASFSVVYPDLENWLKSGFLDRMLLHEAFGVPVGAAVLGVTAFALGCFAIVGRVERWVRSRSALGGGPEELPPPVSLRLATASLALLAFAHLAATHATGHVTTAKLSEAPAVTASASTTASKSSTAPSTAPTTKPARKRLTGGCGG